MIAPTNNAEPTQRVITDEMRVYTEAFAPCLYMRVKVESYNECYYDEKVRQYVNNKSQMARLCRCMSGEYEEYFRDFAPARLSYLYVMGKDITNPLAALKKDEYYYEVITKATNKCHTRHLP